LVRAMAGTSARWISGYEHQGQSTERIRAYVLRR
jgi:hypothetical protein